MFVDKNKKLNLLSRNGFFNVVFSFFCRGFFSILVKLPDFVTNVALGILPIQPGKYVGRCILLDATADFFKIANLTKIVSYVYAFIASAFCIE